jgi:hypothetical protein
MRKLFWVFLIYFFTYNKISAQNSNYYKSVDSIKNINQIKINNKILTKEDILSQYSFYKYLNSKNILKNYKITDAEILAKIIQNELLHQKALQLKIEIPADLISQNLEDFVINNFNNYKNFEKTSLNKKWKIEDIKREIEAQFIWNKIINEILKPSINISQIEVNEWFEKEKINNKNYRYLIKKIQILENKIINIIDNEYYDLINKNKYNNFIENIISQNSNDNINIDISWYWNHELSTIIDNEINKISIGEYSRPLKIEKFWYIFKVIDKKLEYNFQISEYDDLLNKINEKKLMIAIDGFIKELHKSAYIQLKNNRNIIIKNN